MLKTSKSPFAVQIARAFLLATSSVLGIGLAHGFETQLWIGALSGTAFAFILIAIDGFLSTFTLRGFSWATFGLLIGLLCAHLITRIGILELPFFQDFRDADTMQSLAKLALYVTFAFFGVTLALRSDRNDFSFIIPYVKFRQDAVQEAPLILNSEAATDPRVRNLYQLGFIRSPIIIPRFVLEELQELSASSDSVQSSRGQRGLEQISRLKSERDLEVIVQESTDPGDEKNETRFINLARRLGAKVISTNPHLTRIAKLRNLEVLNMHDLPQAARVELHPGDEVTVHLVRAGKDPHQAVAYLPDGGMLVVNHASTFLGETVPVIISGITQTNAGRLIFADMKPKEHSSLI